MDVIRLYKEKIRVSGGQTDIARAVLAWSPTVAVRSTWACLKVGGKYGATPVAMDRGEVVVNEPNQTTARKLAPLLIIQYSLARAKFAYRSNFLQILNQHTVNSTHIPAV
jgi:hypothetical protein